MSTHTDSLAAAAADAVTAPLDLLLTDAALGALRRVNPGGSGLRLAAALAARPFLVENQHQSARLRALVGRRRCRRVARRAGLGGVGQDLRARGPR